ncbi:toll/interleukin-1 receptor domain-containing protein [Gordonia aquimaris]|uniref:Toll/interleukin-1 receptor domain-containing protein n=2 Tax=Gordonia TaxID=2053 RepID=A0A9X3I6T0_9ACTN|nr:toll/interleukin-1 receptor domain-containing protein [Gordonia aquimaris]MCX2967198.1 toll/interleukin-1 receptor domain-containing protein [Gordonia aquimaris]
MSVEEASSVEPQAASVPKYDAFVSYRRNPDIEIAKEIQRGLQKWGKLRRRDPEAQVFRDDTDLVTGEELPQAIIGALHSSRFLILLASPESAVSASVDSELEKWFTRGGVGSVLVVLTGGSLSWDDDHQVTPDSTAINPRFHHLFRGSPLCIDGRWMRGVDSSKLASEPQFKSAVLSRLIAPIRGVSQREADLADLASRRRTRWVYGAVISVLSLLLVVALVLGVLQARERIRAEQNLNSALSRSLVAQARALGDRDPDLAGQLLATASRYDYSDLVKAGLLESARLPTVLPISGLPRDAQFNADGSMVAVASDAGTAIYDVALARQIGMVPSVSGPTLSVAISPDGELVATGGRNGHVQLIHLSRDHTVVDTVESRLIIPPNGSSLNSDAMIGQIFFDPSGARLAAKHDNGLAVAELADTLHEANLTALRSNGLGTFTFSRSGRVAVARESTTTVAVLTWSGEGLALRGRIPAEDRAITVSDSGKKLLLTTDNTGTIWDISSPEHPLKQGSFVASGISASFSPNDRTLLVSHSRLGSSQLWDITDPTHPIGGDALPGRVTGVSESSFNPSGTAVATFSGGFRPSGVDNAPAGNEVERNEYSAVRIWPIRGAQRAGLSGGTTVPGRQPQISDDGKRLLTGTTPPKLTDLGSGQQISLTPAAASEAIFLGPSGDFILTTSGTGVLDPHSNSVRAATENSEWPVDSSARVDPIPGSKDVLVSSEARAVRWTYSDTGAPFRDPHTVVSKDIDCASFSPSGKRLAICTDEGVEIMAADGKRTYGAIPTLSPILAFVDDTTFVVGDENSGSLTGYRISDAAVRKTWTRSRHLSGLTEIQTSSSLLGTMDENGILTLWTLPTMVGPTEIMAIDTTLSNLGQSFDISPSGDYLAISDRVDQTSYVIPLDPDRVLNQICTRTRPITQSEWDEYLPGEEMSAPCSR